MDMVRGGPEVENWLPLRFAGGGGGRWGASGSGLGPVTVRLSPGQIQAINECTMDSPKMWMEMARENMLQDDSMMFANETQDIDEWNYMQNDSLWDP
ncbi:hypothetical protein JRO89_XSUnG0058700 [Xanthoceras sorbifolium]|uniref:Uncharacterized protein n=1 Tax=Xanthoceras sorbifolium TaxID=99658 RepID=A0ABQ8GZS1_9ROSI|nr:hypothetical protein JRO89_XSUnG0058700 [Xanthoceras sorbifolium]